MHSNLTIHNCRVCLRLPEETQILDTRTICDEDLTYAECFLICTQIDLAADDDLPHNLCKHCALELQMSYDFYIKVEKSKILLRKYQEEKKRRSQSQLSTSTIVNKENGDKNIDNTKLQSDVSSSSLRSSRLREIVQLEEILVTQVPCVTCDIESIDEPFVQDVAESEEVEEHLEAEEFQSLEELEDEGNKTEKENDYESDVPVALETHFTIFEGTTINEPEKIQEKNTEIGLNKVKANNQRMGLNLKISENQEKHQAIITDKMHPESKAKINDQTHKSLNKRTRHVGSYECNYCRKSFPNYSRMAIHQRSHEVDRPKFSCEFCSRMYSTKQALEVHVRAIHIKSGFSCSICSKIFPVKKNLEIHMRYHTGDFPYVCDLCGRKFAQMCHLNTHKNVKHDSVRFICDYPDCGKYFTSSNSLRNHEYTHHNMMPFECEFCQQGYPAKAKLKVHIKRKHGQDMSKEQLESMRKFHVMRSKVNLVKVTHINDI